MATGYQRWGGAYTSQLLLAAAGERIGEQSDGRLWYHLRCLADRGSPKIRVTIAAGSLGLRASC